MHRNLALACIASVALSAPTAHAHALLQGRDLDGVAANGFEAYYDPDLDITWLADANRLSTELAKLPSQQARADYVNRILATVPTVAGHAVTLHDLGINSQANNPSGAVTWWGAMAFARAATPFGIGGWQLPTLIDIGGDGCNRAYHDSDCGWSVRTDTSPLARMYYDHLDRPPGRGPLGQQWPAYGIPNELEMPIPDVTNGVIHNLISDSYWYATSDATDDDKAWSFYNTGGEQSVELKNGLFAIHRAWLVHPGDVSTSTNPPSIPEPSGALLLLAGLGAVAGCRPHRRAHDLRVC